MVGLENPLHLIFVLLIVLMLFGAKRLPEMGKSLGAGVRGFKESISGDSPTHPVAGLTAGHNESAQERRDS